VWGGISRKGATKLIVFPGIMDAEFYTETILKNVLLPSINHLYPPPMTHRLWQDNDPKHTSKRAKKFMEENGINWFKAPAESPDLNVIENVWSTMKFYVSKKNPKNQKELIETLNQVWETHLTVLQCNRYIDHIRKVLPKVIAAEGGHSGC
jgi:transposase